MAVNLKPIQNKLSQALKQDKGLSFIVPLLKKFKTAEVFLVGGIVRDWFLKRESHDYDFVVRGLPAKKLTTFLKTQGKVNLVGERFGVFKFCPPPIKVREEWGCDNNPLSISPLERGRIITEIDIALPRTEHAWGTGGYRDVETQSDWQLPIEEDLQRRDFTINALALKIQIQNAKIKISDLIDPFKGLKDLKNKIIRTVGEPAERFQEDYSRLLRSLRLAVQLNFQIEDATWWMLVKKMPRIKTEVVINNEKRRLVPNEVIAKEFLKSLMSQPLKTFDLWDKANVFEFLMPEILKMRNCPQPPQFHAEGDVWQHTRLALHNLETSGFKKFVRTLPKHLRKEPLWSPELVVGLLFHDLGKPYTLKTPAEHGTDRIRTDEHDTAGAVVAKKIGEKMRLSSVADFPCDIEKMAWLIQKHMLVVHGDPLKFANRTIEKYFFNAKNPGGDLLKLIYCDQMASLVNGQPQLGSLPRLVRRIKQLLKNLRQKKSLPPPLLKGDEIMEILKIQPGPPVGEALEKLREAQLAGRIKNKKEAKKFLLSS